MKASDIWPRNQLVKFVFVLAAIIAMFPAHSAARADFQRFVGEWYGTTLCNSQFRYQVVETKIQFEIDEGVLNSKWTHNMSELMPRGKHVFVPEGEEAGGIFVVNGGFKTSRSWAAHRLGSDANLVLIPIGHTARSCSEMVLYREKAQQKNLVETLSVMGADESNSRQFAMRSEFIKAAATPAYDDTASAIISAGVLSD
ncbi:hypothetical protein B5C34_15765 [Pacificimonas flava]|uniref:Uncharacterized protein n=2 Tax=Pacificimonas TaxID=1960290 RepID=A0A219B2B3_9SPHN|nr:hypothetical protein B5C34_15765 [Pacificimonas flava]